MRAKSSMKQSSNAAAKSIAQTRQSGGSMPLHFNINTLELNESKMETLRLEILRGTDDYRAGRSKEYSGATALFQDVVNIRGDAEEAHGQGSGGDGFGET